MKANAPEKLYLSSTGKLGDGISTGRLRDTDIEYTSTDAFIEKACKFLKSYSQDTYDGTGYIAGVINDKTINDFVNYMKGDKV